MRRAGRKPPARPRPPQRGLRGPGLQPPPPHRGFGVRLGGGYRPSADSRPGCSDCLAPGPVSRGPAGCSRSCWRLCCPAAPTAAVPGGAGVMPAWGAPGPGQAPRSCHPCPGLAATAREPSPSGLSRVPPHTTVTRSWVAPSHLAPSWRFTVLYLPRPHSTPRLVLCFPSGSSHLLQPRG